MFSSNSVPTGQLKTHVIRANKGEYGLRDIIQHGLPQKGLSKEVNSWRMRNLLNLWRGVWRVMVARLFKLNNTYGTLYAVLTRANGEVIHYGLASMRVVTTVGVNFIVDAFQNTTELELMKFHGIGTGGTAEAVGDTALVTEITTEYASDNTRPTGTTTEGASANIYRTVATNTVDGSVACTEHGIFDQASNAGGVLLDRTLFTVINLSSGDSLQTTYELTFTAGS